MTVRRINETLKGASVNERNSNKSLIAHSHGTKARTSILQTRVVLESIRENRSRRQHRRSNALLLGNICPIEAQSSCQEMDITSSFPSEEIPSDKILSQLLLSESIPETTQSFETSSSCTGPPPSQITPSSSILSSFTSSSGEFDDEECWSEIYTPNQKPSAGSVGRVRLLDATLYPPADIAFHSDDDSIVFSASASKVEQMRSLSSDELSGLNPASTAFAMETMVSTTDHSCITNDTDHTIKEIDISMTSNSNHDPSHPHQVQQNPYDDWEIQIPTMNDPSSELLKKSVCSEPSAVVCHEQQQQSVISMMMHHIHLQDNHSHPDHNSTALLIPAGTTSISCGF